MSSLFTQPYLALAGGVPNVWPTPMEVSLYLLGITIFVILNAIYVAAEFALLKIRLSQAEGLMESEPKRAKRIITALGNLNGYLSACQLGITIASLALGALGEPFVMKLIGRPMHYLPISEEWMRILSWLIATGTFAAVHVVIGEQVPKVLAIRKPIPTCLKLINFIHIFYFIFGPAVNALNSISNWILLKIFKVEPAGHEEVHSAEEIAQLVELSERHDEVTETEREILINALELNDVSVKDVLTPRSEVIALDVDDSFEKNVEIALASKHTRFPLVRGHLDHSLGLVHIKDFLKLVGHENPDLAKVKRPLRVVPETMKLDDLLKFFLKERAHLAMAVDEFGDPAGLVFMDNVMEELVGDIQDEFDNETSDITQISEHEFVVEGSMSLNELSDYVSDLDLESGEISTIGGYVTQQLGRFPNRGEKMKVEGFEATITGVSSRRVGQIHFRRRTPGEAIEGVSGED